VRSFNMLLKKMR